MSMMSTASKAKKPGRPKKGQTKSNGRTTRAKATESQPPSSFVEPEDDNFEVKVASPTARSTRGKKRTSDEMQAGDVEYPIIPPAKRATRTRSSTAKPEAAPVPVPEEDTPMENTEESIPAPKSKKGGKGGRKRASTTTRKPSGRKASTRSASTASKAPLRATVPADEEIDAQLEAELNRLSSDGEENWQVLGKDESELMEIHMPRTRPVSAKPTPSASTGGVPESNIVVSQGHPDDVEQSESVIFERTEPIMSSPVAKKPTRAATKKNKKGSYTAAAKKRQQPKADDVDHMDVDTEEVQESHVETPAIQTAQEGNGILPTNDSETIQEQHNVSQITMTTAADDSGHETDGSVLAQQKVKGNSKKPAAKKGKQAKKTATKAKKVEVTVEVPITAIDEVQQAEAEAEPVPEEAPVVIVKAKTRAASKPKSTKGQGRAKTSAENASEPTNSPMISRQEQGKTGAGEEPEPNAKSLVEVHIEQPQAPAPTLPPSPKRQAPSPTPTPQSSDAENHPPSARPSQARPPLARFSPSAQRTKRVPLAPSTPSGSPSRGNISKLKTAYPWSAADLDYILIGTPNADKENANALDMAGGLTSPEKRMSVEDWIKHNAKQGEEKLRMDCEKIIGKFENEGVRALKALEGIVCSD